MTKAVEKILAEVNALDAAERRELVDALFDLAEPSTDPEYTAAWEAEIERRLADLDSGRVKGIPFQEALEMIKNGGTKTNRTK